MATLYILSNMAMCIYKSILRTLLTLYCFTGLGQLPIIPHIEPVSSASLPAGKEFWWVASDLNGVTPLNYNWVDRIQAKNFKFDINNSWVAPVVTSKSVTFAGNSSLTNDIKNYFFPNLSTGSVYRTLCFLTKPTAGHTANQCYYTATTDAAQDGVTWIFNDRGLDYPGFILAKGVATNAISQSWVFTQTNLATQGNIQMNFYTNGVFSTAPQTVSALSLYRLGGLAGALSFTDIYEVICFTNASRGFNQSEVTQVENYRIVNYP